MEPDNISRSPGEGGPQHGYERPPRIRSLAESGVGFGNGAETKQGCVHWMGLLCFAPRAASGLVPSLVKLLPWASSIT